MNIKELPPEVSPRLSNLILNFAADSIELSHRLAPEKWGVTPYDQGFRLNVGFCEAMTVYQNEMRVLCLQQALPPKLSVKLMPGYTSAPGSVMVLIETAPLSVFKETLLAIRSAHHQILVRSAGRGFNLGAKKGHKNYVVEAIGSATGRSLPVPGFTVESEIRAGQIALGVTEAMEGMAREAIILRRLRSRALRDTVMSRANGRCFVCEVDFSKILHGLGTRVLQVHHLKQLSVGSMPRTTKVEDLVVVCANCHCLIHADPDRAAPPNELQLRLRFSVDKNASRDSVISSRAGLLRRSKQRK